MYIVVHCEAEIAQFYFLETIKLHPILIMFGTQICSNLIIFGT